MRLQQCRWLLLLVILVTELQQSTVLARRKHRIRHAHHRRPKRQHGGSQVYSYVLERDAGPWGLWGTQSPCSRSCGGGVAFQTRRCTDERPDGTSSCQGPNKQYLSCNVQPCPEGTGDLRAEQCAEFDRLPFEGRFYSWVPYLKAPNQCELNCQPRGERFYYRHKRKVIDGTSCGPEGLDVCVDGQCMQVGCDRMLGSTVKEDKCRVCGGDGSDCYTAEGLFDAENLQAGYNDILLIPQGATNILIEEIRATNNYLAIRNLTGHYYLNGNWRIDYPATLEFAGSKFHYERKPLGFFAPESVRALGPTTEALYVVLLYQEKNEGIQYEYSVPRSVADAGSSEYSWVPSGWSDCSQQCGGGTRSRQLSCIRSEDRVEVSSDLCDVLVKPAESEVCNEQPCQASWKVGNWSECSAGCGQGGVRYRTVTCEQKVSGDVQAVVDDQVCARTAGARPAHMEECNTDPTDCPSYHVGDWSPCDRLCGDGEKTRQVLCHRVTSTQTVLLEPSECEEAMPNATEPCFLRPCEGVDWVTSDWSGCEGKCGLQTETRSVQCVNMEGQAYDDEYCQQSRRPGTRQDCLSSVPCEYSWYTTQWSECSATCGTGLQTRRVFCASVNDEGMIVPTEDEHCDPERKYDGERECEAESETSCAASWMAGPWGPCSASCEGGTQSREVFCTDGQNRVDIALCGDETIPSALQECNQMECAAAEEIKKLTLIASLAFDPSALDEECAEEDQALFSGGGSGADLDDGLNVDFLDLLARAREEEAAKDSVEDSELSGASGEDSSSSEEDSSSSEESMSSEESGSEEESGMPDLGDDDGEDMSGGMAVDMSGEMSADMSGEMSGEMSADMSGEMSGESVTTDPPKEVLEGLESIERFKRQISINPSALDDVTLDSSVESSGDMSGEMSGDMSGDEDMSGEMSGESSGLEPSDTSGDISGEMSGDMPELSDEIPMESDSDVTSGDISADVSGDMSGEASGDMSTEDMIEDSGSGEEMSSEKASGEFIDMISGEAVEDDAVSGDASGELSGEPSGDAMDDEISGEDMMKTGDVSGEMSGEVSGDISGEQLLPGELSGDDSMEESGMKSGESGEESGEVSAEESEESGEEMESGSGEIDELMPASGEEEDQLMPDGSAEGSGDISGSGEEEDELMPRFGGDTDKEKADEKKERCRPRPVRILCEAAEFGCCPDGLTVAAGPFHRDCPEVTSCQKTKFGCCPDRVTPAGSEDMSDCPPAADCTKSLFGCCPDNFTEMEDAEGSSCPNVTRECEVSRFGCCTDSDEAAEGPFDRGCPDKVQPTEEPPADDDSKMDEEAPKNCTDTEFGCCADGVTAATGPDQEGCPAACLSSEFGCCDNGYFPAHGPNGEGCCLNTLFGCCPDNISPARGPGLEGCGCEYSAFGCCPDNRTLARGPELEGCGCQYTEHGCCPDQYTPAAGPDQFGCGCHTFPYGCCPDGETVAQGPNQEECGCDYAEFGCCPDRRTPAAGPNYQGCGCETYPYGCCPDGVTEAAGADFEGCDDKPLKPAEICGMPKERGSCRNFTVRWFFDMEYGGCSRFWYGGCDGNDNSFETQESCKALCVEPEGMEACQLPVVKGACDGYYPSWYYNRERSRCEPFVYGGCLGNGNRFATVEECQETCVIPETLDPCEQEVMPGPCAGNNQRWFFDKESSTCREFNYGGCKANENNFLTKEECTHRCARPGRKAICSLPRAEGSCGESLPRWYFDYQESRCSPFYYTGCEGNLNQFESEEECEESCPSHVYAAEACTDPQDPGPCANYTIRYSYDLQEGRCRPFYYGGCEGNRNNFRSDAECREKCESRKVETEPTQFEIESCFLPGDAGTSCSDAAALWYYDSRIGVCTQFMYGGCGGNPNRFRTRDECRQRCGAAQDVCSLPRVVGPCSGSLRQYYFDVQLGRCLEFDYGGCQGNDNKFNSLRECAERCGGPAEGAPRQPEWRPEPEPEREPEPEPEREPEPEWEKDERPTEERMPDETSRPEEGLPEVCSQPYNPGPCRVPSVVWFYSADLGICRQFTYGGCRGNDNKFVSQEQCKRTCGEFRNQDACGVPPSGGDCGGSETKWYFDYRDSTCRPFEYTGCGGNANRFATEDECQTLCVQGTEPAVPDLEEEKNAGEEVDTEPPVPEVTQTPQPRRRPTTTTARPTPAADVDCSEFTAQCDTMRCPFGLERRVDDNGCERCYCYNPCTDVSCGGEQRCAISYGRDEEGGLIVSAVCRFSNKTGECSAPIVEGECPGDTRDGCRDDADCRNNLKCCNDGCTMRCLPPDGEEERLVQETKVTPLTTTPAPVTEQEMTDLFTEATVLSTERQYGAESTAPTSRPDPYTTPSDRWPVYPPSPRPPTPARSEVPARIIEHEPEAEANEGELAVLKCAAEGDPQPQVVWTYDNRQVDTSRGRYRLERNGTLVIVGVRRDDGGEYRCRADNRLAAPDTRTVTLTVLGPVPRQAAVLRPSADEQPVVELGGPAVIRCYAYGWPRPSVTWWRDQRMLPLSSERVEQSSDQTLVLRLVRLQDLGTYTCQAYNGQGRAVSWSTQLRAYGPVFSSESEEDRPFLQFLVTRPQQPTASTRAPPPPQPTTFPARRPGEQPYYPDYVTRPTRPPTPSVTSPTVQRVAVRASINMTETMFTPGVDIRIPCETSGYPTPRVTWYKDSVPLQPDERRRLQGDELLVLRAEPADSGSYRCEVENVFSAAESTVTITVQGVYIHPNCTDNPFFANCELIVNARYCANQYYARFCCRSCTLAGQLSPTGRHLQGYTPADGRLRR